MTVTTTEPRAADATLEDLLARRIEATRASLLAGDGRVDTADIQEIEHLARFVALRKDAQPAKPQHHLLAVALLVTTLVAVSLLMYATLPATEVEVFAATSQVGFRVAAPQSFSDGVEVRDLLLTCACDIRIPSTPGKPSRVLTTSGADAVVRLTAAGEGERKGSITIAPIALQPGAQVRLRHRGTPGAYALSIESAGLLLRVNVYGTIDLAIPGELPSEVDFVVPKAMQVSTGGKALALDLQATNHKDLGLVPQLLVDELSFLRIDEPASPGQPVRRVSTLHGGTLYWEALNGEERTLRPSEQIAFDEVRGEIVAVDLKDTDMALRFHGEVGAVTAGWGQNRRSLMPTWLEWLRARHGLSLLWGSTVYIVGLLMGALRWFKVSW